MLKRIYNKLNKLKEGKSAILITLIRILYFIVVPLLILATFLLPPISIQRLSLIYKKKEVAFAAVQVVPTEGLNLKSGPGTAYHWIAPLHGGDKLYVKARTSAGDWLKVSTADGIEGWISAAYATYAEPLPTSPYFLRKTIGLETSPLVLGSLVVPQRFMPNAQWLYFLEIGNLQIEAPNVMKVGEIRVVKATLTVNPALNQSPSGLITATHVEFSPVVYAFLGGLGFETYPSNDGQPRLVSPGKSITWTWQIKAKIPGERQPISIQITAPARDKAGLIKELGGKREELIAVQPPETRYIRVIQPIFDRILSNQFFQNLVIAMFSSTVLATIITYFLNRRLDERLHKILEEKIKQLTKDEKAPEAPVIKPSEAPWTRSGEGDLLS